MRRCYRVAGLTFALDLPAEHPAADRLHNYDPFQVPESRETIFSLSTVPEAPEGGRETLYAAPEASGEPVVRLSRLGEDYLAEFAPRPSAPVCGQLAFDADFRRGRLFASGSPADQTFALNNALMLLFAFAATPFRVLEMHAAAVCRGGRAFLFLGRSGTGKSTHGALWIKHIEGTELLNDDNPVLRIADDGSIRAFGTPWSGKTPCYKAEDAPVGAIVRLRQDTRNRIARLGTVAAYASVLAACSGFRPLRAVTDAQHETLAAVAERVPCYQLDCLPDEAAARLCQSTVDG